MSGSKPKSFDCPKCGERYYDAQRFCVKCGLDFRAAFRVCPKCKMDTPAQGEECTVCGFNLETHDIRRPKLILAGIVILVIAGVLIVPIWWSRTPLFKNHGKIVSGEFFFLAKDRLEFVPMFYEYQSGQKALRSAAEGGSTGMTGEVDPDALIPMPTPLIPYVNLSIGEEVFITAKQVDSDGRRWYHIRRFRKDDVVRKGWVLADNVQLE